MKAHVFSTVLAALFVSTLRSTPADRATWQSNPTSTDWNTVGDWTPETVPNGPTDAATFAVSSITALKFSADANEVAEIAFNPGANRFNIGADSSLAKSEATLTTRQTTS